LLYKPHAAASARTLFEIPRGLDFKEDVGIENKVAKTIFYKSSPLDLIYFAPTSTDS
jgi:hypothetical protein